MCGRVLAECEPTRWGCGRRPLMPFGMYGFSSASRPPLPRGLRGDCGPRATRGDPAGSSSGSHMDATKGVAFSDPTRPPQPKSARVVSLCSPQHCTCMCAWGHRSSSSRVIASVARLARRRLGANSRHQLALRLARHESAMSERSARSARRGSDDAAMEVDDGAAPEGDGSEADSRDDAGKVRPTSTSRSQRGGAPSGGWRERGR